MTCGSAPFRRSPSPRRRGRGKTLYAAWEGRRRVRLWMTASRNAPIGVRVNGHLVRRHHHRFGETTDLDITAHLRFGGPNTLTLVATPNGDYDEHPVALDECRLDLFEIR